ncbi:MAG: BTAD domain-containing putative transcriptional regulator, partial [Candidatus Xenobia bacterium]
CSGRERSVHQREEEILQSVLGGIPELEPCIPIIVQRHEWFDGKGSIMGLSGDRIKPEARALAVVDAFVDLATPKTHRDPASIAEVLRRIKLQSGTQFDPAFVAALAAAVDEEEGLWGATARSRRFETSRCRHWLDLGGFYRSIGERDWALRCYLAASKTAGRIPDPDLEMEATWGQFMVFCDQGQVERARETLNNARKQVENREDAVRQRFLLMWGWLEWLTGKDDNGEQILDGLAQQYRAARELQGLSITIAAQASMLLWHRGVDDAGHVRWLAEFMDLVEQHDLFDVLARYRAWTLPLLLSAIIHDIKPVLARSMLTRMGEPVQENPAQALGHYRPEGRIVEAPSAAPPAPSRAPELRVMLMGRCQIQSGHAVLREDDWPSHKAMKLFAYLASRGQNAASDLVLMDTFWPDSDEQRARNSLRNAVHQIRHAIKMLLGEGVHLERSRKTQTLLLQVPYWLDTRTFEDGVRDASALYAARRPQEAIAILTDVLPLYRGEFIEGSHDEWIEGLRTQLGEVYLRGLHLQARCLLAIGDAEAAELVARRAIQADDLREDLHGDLIEALTAQGRRGEALRHYQDTVSLFEREMGVLPSSLTSIYDRLLAEIRA